MQLQAASSVQSTTFQSVSPRILHLTVFIAAVSSCIASTTLLLWGLLREGPAFYNGQECQMTYSQFQFLPLYVPSSSSLENRSYSESSDNRYRLLKFTDARDPRHKHLFKISGSMIENHIDKSRITKNRESGRLLNFHDNWCLLPRNITNLIQATGGSAESKRWKDVPYPHRGHPVLYVPGHWGSFSQARSIGAHGTRWTGQNEYQNTSHQDIYKSFLTGVGMHDGTFKNPGQTWKKSKKDLSDWLLTSSSPHLENFVMDVFSLDFDGGEGAALHSSILLRQAEFFAMAVETIVEGCHLSNRIDSDTNDIATSITIVAHSIGAWVVRIAFKLHPHLTSRGWVRNVITLASPLGFVPYAVDAGVHDMVKYFNEINHGGGDVSIVSISGGLRDEMIPPESCQVPPMTKSNAANNMLEKNDTTGKIESEAFLATSLIRRGSGEVDSISLSNAFGMDHRAIVWCYDLLKGVREVIFALVVTTDHGLASHDRLDIIRSIVYDKSGTVNRKESPQKSKTIQSFQENVRTSWNLLLKEKGYLKTVAIQLSSPYNLNALLKLCILCSLFHIHYITPMIVYFKQSLMVGNISHTAVLFELGLSLLLIPLSFLLLSEMKRLLLLFLSLNIEPWYHLQEFRLLHATIFILVQLSTTISSLICLGVSSVIKSRRMYLQRRDAKKRLCGEILPSTVFSTNASQAIFQQSGIQHLYVFTVIIFLSVVRGIFTGEELSTSCYIFLSIVAYTLFVLVNMLCTPSDWANHQETGIFLVIFLSIIKATHGKANYAFSILTQWKQADSILSKSQIEMMFIHPHAFVMCFMTVLLPALLASSAIQTHSVMIQNWMLTFDRADKNESKDGTYNTQELHTKIAKYSENKFLEVSTAILVFWYAWNVSVSYANDDLLITFYSIIIFIKFYLRCSMLSSKTLDIVSVITNNDLLLSHYPDNHNKRE